jgi:hypothetical protein
MSKDGENTAQNTQSPDSLKSDIDRQEKLKDLALVTVLEYYENKCREPYVWEAYEAIKKKIEGGSLDEADKILNSSEEFQLYVNVAKKDYSEEQEAEIKARESERIKNIEKEIAVVKEQNTIIKEQNALIKKGNDKIIWSTSTKVGIGVGVTSGVIVTLLVMGATGAFASSGQSPNKDLFNNNSNELTKIQNQFILSNITNSSLNVNITKNYYLINNNRYCKNQMPALSDRLFTPKGVKKFHL